MRVDRSTAFHVNSVGVARAPFPLSFDVIADDGVHIVTATAAGAGDLIDVLAPFGPGFVAVLNAHTNSWLDQDHRPWPVDRIAREQQVEVVVHSHDAIVLHRAQVAQFLAGWSTYGIDLFDLATEPTAADLDELALEVECRDPRDAILPRLGKSGFFASVHDDCYIHLETTDAQAPARLLARLLTLMAGFALLGDQEAVDLTEPPDDLVAQVLQADCPYLGQVASVLDGEVSIALSMRRTPWRLPDGVPDVPVGDLTAVYANGAWELRH